MSKFKTVIVVDVQAVKDLLPPGSHLNAVVFNPVESQVEVLWEHDAFKTPYTFEQPFPIDALERQQLPKGVKLDPRRLPKPVLTPATAPVPPVEPIAHIDAPEPPTAAPAPVVETPEPPTAAPAPVVEPPVTPAPVAAPAETPKSNVPTERKKSTAATKARK